MKKIVVCYKWVVDENDIAVDSDGRIQMRNPAYQVSLYDRNAIEEGVSLSEATGVPCIALTAGDSGVEKSRKEALCMGPSEGFAVEDDLLVAADSGGTAKTLAKAIEKIGDVDVVLCGEGSGDVYAHQVGPRIAALLGYPFVGYATSIKAEDDGLVITRSCSQGVETLKASCPIVISVAGDCNQPRLAGMKEILKAGKKPWTVYALDDLGLDAAEVAPAFARTKTIGNVPDRKNMVIKGSAEEIANEIVKNLIGEGVL